MYLLLRNNKQSGPYSLEEIKTLGLKAYDLVWIEGKSAAWRYPCEIEELSAYAPAVEEQPFDRFYKKSPSPVKANANSSAVVTEPSKPVTDGATTLPPSPVYSGEPSTVAGKRIIYVTMPAGRPQVSPPPVQPTPDYFPENNYAQQSHEGPSNEEFLPRLQSRHSSRIVKPLVIGLTVLAVLAAGIFIGLSINKDTSFGLKQKIAASAHSLTPVRTQPVSQSVSQPTIQPDPAPVVTVQQPAAATTSQQPPATTSAVDPAITANKPALTEKNVSAEKPAIQQNAVSQKPSGGTAAHTGRTPAQGTKEKSAAKTPTVLPPAAKDAVANDPALVPHREAVHRTDPDGTTENTDKAAEARAAIVSQVSASTNGYTVGTFGGITGLQVTVSNHSAYPLDLVVVEVQYIQANKKTYKTENLYFRGIGAGSALMQEAPKSSRGVRVQYKITMISSKELGLSYSGI